MSLITPLRQSFLTWRAGFRVGVWEREGKRVIDISPDHEGYHFGLRKRGLGSVTHNLTIS